MEVIIVVIEYFITFIIKFIIIVIIEDYLVKVIEKIIVVKRTIIKVENHPTIITRNFFFYHLRHSILL